MKRHLKSLMLIILPTCMSCHKTTTNVSQTFTGCRITRTVQHYPGGQPDMNTYSYSSDQHIAHILYQNGPAISNSYTLYYLFRPHYQLEKVERPNTPAVTDSLVYDENIRLTSIFEKSETGGYLPHEHFVYDSAGSLSMICYDFATPTTADTLQWQGGDLVQINSGEEWGEAPTVFTITYDTTLYRIGNTNTGIGDALYNYGNICSVKHLRKQTVRNGKDTTNYAYSFDNNGNVTSMIMNSSVVPETMDITYDCE